MATLKVSCRPFLAAATFAAVAPALSCAMGVTSLHDAVQECAVIGVPHDKWGETPKAIVVRRPGTSVTSEELTAFCRQQLAHFKCPTSIEFTESLPRTATGKLQKYRLREKYWKGRERKVAG